MSTIYVLLFFISIICFFIGLARPKTFKMNSRKNTSLLFSISSLVFFILLAISIPNNSNLQDVTNASDSQQIVASTTSETVVTNDVGTSSTKVVTKTEEKKVTSTNTSITANSNRYLVTEVVDGDTAKVNINGTITTLRLIGLDTPETVDPRKPVQCFGKEASNKAKELLSGTRVTLEYDDTQGTVDKYGRTLAYVIMDNGVMYNKYMIENGYAHEYTYSKPYKYQVEFKAAQKSAQDNQRGFWSANTCNGDTSSINTTTSSSNTTTVAASNSEIKFYTSSYSTAKNYFPVECEGWKSLSKDYLKGFKTLEDLLKAYPNRTKSASCQ